MGEARLNRADNGLAGLWNFTHFCTRPAPWHQRGAQHDGVLKRPIALRGNENSLEWHNFPSRLSRVPRDVVLHDGRLPADLEGTHRVFNVPILDRHALVLSEVLRPRLHHECLDPAAWIGQILE